MPEPIIDRTWPISVATTRKALLFKADEGDETELAFFAQTACERIDKETGRNIDPTRHMVLVDGEPKVPLDFIMAARELARFGWQQSKNGPRGIPQTPSDQPAGLPIGIDLPRKVQGILANYPPPPGFGQSES